MTESQWLSGIVGRLDAKRMQAKHEADLYRWRLDELAPKHFRLAAWAWFRSER